MDNVFIHLRGATGCGKSTAARQFMEHGRFAEKTIRVGNVDCDYNEDAEQRIIVTGRYKPNVDCGGLDGKIEDKELMLNYLAKLMKLSPKAIVFEAVMYGMTVSFTQRLVKLCKALGYKYKGVLLCPAFEDNLEMITKRNGGKAINVAGLWEKNRNAKIAAERLVKQGVDIDFVDTAQAQVKYEDMWRIVAERL